MWLQFHIKLEPLEGKVQKELMVGLKDKDDSPPFKSARWYAANLQWHNASSEPQVHPTLRHPALRAHSRTKGHCPSTVLSSLPDSLTHAHSLSLHAQMIAKQINRIANDINIIFEVEGSFVELFELKHFPFDHQSVTAKLRCQCALEGKVPVVFTGLHTAVEVVDVEKLLASKHVGHREAP